MKKIVFTVAILLVAGNANSAEWVSKWFDGPAPANYENVTGGVTRTYVNMPAQGGHVEWTLNTSAPTKTGGSFFSGATSGSNAAAAARVSIPYGYAAGGAAITGVTMTAAILKPNLAKAVAYAVRINPYVATALTFGWLANAGYQYFKETDTFGQQASTIVRTFNHDLLVQYAQTANQTSCVTSGSRSYANYGGVDYVVGTTNNIKYLGYSLDYASWGGYSFHPCFSLSNAQVTEASNCPAGYTSSSDNCVPGPSVPPVSVTPAQVETGLANSPMTPAGDTPAAQAGVVDELIKAGVYPDNETPQLTGPSSTPGETSTTTNPDGTVITNNTTYNHTYNNNYVDTTGTTTITTTPPSGPPTTTIITKPPTAPPGNQVEQKTDCDKYPDSIGCSKFGTIPTADVIPVTNVALSLNVGAYSDGYCPEPQQLSLGTGNMNAGGATLSISNQPICTLATSTKPLFISLAFLVAGLIVLAPVKG